MGGLTAFGMNVPSFSVVFFHILIHHLFTSADSSQGLATEALFAARKARVYQINSGRFGGLLRHT